jgi:hypothetical protein
MSSRAHAKHVTAGGIWVTFAFFINSVQSEILVQWACIAMRIRKKILKKIRQSNVFL